MTYIYYLNSYGIAGLEVISGFLMWRYQRELETNRKPILPLTVAHFIEIVLFRETLIYLFQEDNPTLSKEAVISVIQDSNDYGMFMFPDSEASQDLVTQMQRKYGRKMGLYEILGVKRSRTESNSNIEGGKDSKKSRTK